MIQSKMVQSSASIDSFRVTPSSVVAKDKDVMATRRNTSGAKTPSKYGATNRYGRGVLVDRNY